MEFFARLGARIGDDWKKADHDEAAFSAIAVGALEEMRPSDHVSMMDVVRWVHSTRSLVRETGFDREFGQPAILAFQGRQFFIEVLFWVDATTAIHQHKFSGAFQVLDGSSIHTRYSFASTKRYNDRLLLGELEAEQVEYLEKGSIRPILNGDRSIHALFHLDHPSVSVVVRTGTSPVTGPQYSYLSSGIAFDPFHSSESLYLKTRTLAVLAGMPHPEWKQLAASAVRDADAFDAFFLLRRFIDFVQSKEEYDALLDDIVPAHPELVAHARVLYDAETRERNITKRRATIRRKEHRLFLALLLNVRSRTEMLRIVEEVFPGESPVKRVVGWTEELSKESIPDPHTGEKTSLLGLRLDDTALTIFGHLLAGASNEEVLRLLREEFDEADLAAQKDDVLGLCEAFRHSMLFEHVLATPSAR